MANKRITDVDFINSLNSDESFFVNQNNTLKQIDRSDIVWPVANGGTGTTSIASLKSMLGINDNPSGNTSNNLESATGTLQIANGGTGATTAAAARANLGAVSMSTKAITLSASNWQSLSQTVSVSGVTASNTIIVSPAPASSEGYNEAGVSCSAQANGTLTFKCTTEPTTSLTVNVLILV